MALKQPSSSGLARVPLTVTGLGRTGQTFHGPPPYPLQSPPLTTQEGIAHPVSISSEPPEPPNPTPEQLFLSHLPLIEEIAEHAGRWAKFRPEDIEDFVSWVRIRLMEDDYRVFRQFQQRANLKTFLNVVIRNLARDYRNSLLGKWRPSAEAERLGKVAVRLETLMVRDGYSFSVACEILRTNEKAGISEAELEDLAAKLPVRMGRIIVGEDGLQGKAAKDPPPDQGALEHERDGMGRRVYAALQRALSTLPGEDRLLVMMSLNFKVAEIARARKLEQKPLYRRLEKIHKTLRKALEREGVRREDVKEILGSLESDSYAQPKKRG